MIKVFFSYSHKDSLYREKLDIHLALLKKHNYISSWHDRKIPPGQEWDKVIIEELESADIILLLVSPDFLASQYCYDIEVKRALQLHEEERAIVLPIILRHCDWQLSLFEKLKCLPEDSHPVTSGFWRNEDEAFLSIVEGLKKAIALVKERRAKHNSSPSVEKIGIHTGDFHQFIDRYILENNTFIGIDFGTSISVISIITFNKLRNEIKLEPISFDFYLENSGYQSSCLVPSVICFNQNVNKISFGQEAKLRRYHPDTFEGINYWSSFKMQLGKDLGNVFTSSLLREGEHRILNPQDAAKEFFKFLRSSIENHITLNKLSKNLKISISIPASFEANQRRELLEAIKDADINISSHTFIDEPNAAFLNYITQESISLLSEKSDRQYTLVFDFGAGTCDVSILEFGKKNHGFFSKNISISKFEQLGGDDIDKKIAREILFVDFCEEFDLDIKTITDVEYVDYFEPKLKPPAEALKIKICEQIAKLHKKRAKIPDITVFCEEPVSVTFRGKRFIFESQVLSVAQFQRIIKPFVDDDPDSDESIFFVIKSALQKAEMVPNDIDNLLLIGGSCKNLFIVNALKEKFSQSTLLIPSNLQTQVSQGAALNALLSIGLSTPPIAPIISETISIRLLNNAYFPVINQGEEIPHFKEFSDAFCVQRERQDIIEIPLYVSGEKKMLEKIYIKSESWFRKTDLFKITIEVDTNKILTVKVYCNGKNLEVKHLSPFANEVLTPYKRVIKETEKEINNFLSEGYTIHDNELIDLVESLITVHSECNNYKNAMEYTIKYFPNRYTDIAYFASCAGYDKISTEYTIKAYNADPSDINAYNLALEYSKDSMEYEKYIRIASELGNLSAKIALGQILLKSGRTEARSIMMDVFDILFSRYQINKNSLSVGDYEDLIIVVQYLKYTDILKEIEESQKQMEEIKRNAANNLFSEENLLKEHKSS